LAYSVSIIDCFFSALKLTGIKADIERPDKNLAILNIGPGFLMDPEIRFVDSVPADSALDT
jgi:hypothetical protein